MKTRSQLDTDLATLMTLVTTVVSTSQAGLAKLNVGKAAILSPQAVVATAGQSFSIAVNFTPGPDAITALQFDLLLPPGFTFTSVALGAAGTAAGKSISYAAITGGERFIAAGLNTTPIGNGILLTITGVAGTTKGPLALTITNIAGSKADGTSARLIAMSASITVQ